MKQIEKNNIEVVILCGGKGTRLSEETLLKPKPMVEVVGKPILTHIMNCYSSYGFNNFTLALGYKGDLIKEYFLNYKKISSNLRIEMSQEKLKYIDKNNTDWNINLINTGQEVMTGGRLLRLSNILSDKEYFMLTYGDGLCDVNINELLDFHINHGKIGTVTAVKPQARFGSLKLNKNMVSRFDEKNTDNQDWINGGFFIFGKKIFDYLQDDQTILERSPLENLSKNNELVAFKHHGYWQCMDTLRDKEILEESFNNGSPLWAKKI